MSESEMLDILNEEMVVIGTDSRVNAHARGLWHQTFHCWIVRQSTHGETNLLFQLRHRDKDTYPGLLDISCAGHLQAGETVADGVRELREELGVIVSFTELTSCGIVAEENIISEQCIDREFNHIFILQCNKSLEDYHMQTSEISGLFYINMREFKELLKSEKNSIWGEGIVMDEMSQNVRSIKAEFHIDDFTPMSNNYAQVLFDNLERLL